MKEDDKDTVSLTISSHMLLTRPPYTSFRTAEGEEDGREAAYGERSEPDDSDVRKVNRLPVNPCPSESSHSILASFGSSLIILFFLGAELSSDNKEIVSDAKGISLSHLYGSECS